MVAKLQQLVKNVKGPKLRFKAPRFEDFFDRPEVIARLTEQERKVLTRIGAFIRTTARRSMRKGGKTAKARISRPGEPPRYHTKLLRGSQGSRFGVQFSYDRARNSVVVGPNLIPGKQSQTRVDSQDKKPVKVSADKPVPAVLEAGGRVSFVKTSRRSSAKIAPRPYMKPAHKKAIAAPKLKKFWNQIRF